MKKKIFAGIAAAAMAISLVACGEAPATTETPATDATDAPAVEEVAVTPSIDFEDGNFAFAAVATELKGGDPTTLSVEDVNGSKVLKTANAGESAKVFIGLDLDSILGDKIVDVKKIQCKIGVDGDFNAVSGYT